MFHPKYVYVAFAKNDLGDGFSMKWQPGLSYMVILPSEKPILNPSPAEFAGANWIQITPGRDGKVGPVGRDGKVGPPGKDGKVGPPGKDGKVGPAGKDGKVGPAGKDGKVGPPGRDGKVGPAGRDSKIGGNLIQNGYGQLGDATGFPGLNFVEGHGPEGRHAFKLYSTSREIIGSQIIPVDTARFYNLSCYGRYEGKQAPRQYIGLVPVDVNGLTILPWHHMRIADTRLARPLRPGDKVVYLEDATGFVNNGPWYQRGLVIWGYKNAQGFNHGEYTYSRHIFWKSGQGAWLNGAVSNNTISLHVPFPQSLANPDDPNGVWPAGQAISNSNSGSTYKYITLANGLLNPEWTRYSGFIGGVDDSGKNATNKFPPGTAGVKLLFFFNYESYYSVMSWLSGINFWPEEKSAPNKGNEPYTQEMFRELLDLPAENLDLAQIRHEIGHVGGNLIQNGYGQLGDATGFPGLNFAEGHGPEGRHAFKLYSTSRGIIGSQIIPVDTARFYNLSCYGRYEGKQAPPCYGRYEGKQAPRQYIGLVPVDVNGLTILPWHHMRIADTRLARPLRPGDKVVYLEDATGFVNNGPWYQRGLVIWGYKNAQGFNHGEYTYSRHIFWKSGQGAWLNGAVSNNTISLHVPFPQSLANPDDPNGVWPAGQAISNSNSGSTYKYITLANGLLNPEWTRYSGFIGGVDDSGKNATNKFPPGTAGVKLLFLFNYGSSYTSGTYVADIQLLPESGGVVINSLLNLFKLSQIKTFEELNKLLEETRMIFSRIME